MGLFDIIRWLTNAFPGSNRCNTRGKRVRNPPPLMLEALETRTVPTTITQYGYIGGQATAGNIQIEPVVSTPNYYSQTHDATVSLSHGDSATAPISGATASYNVSANAAYGASTNSGSGTASVTGEMSYSSSYAGVGYTAFDSITIAADASGVFQFTYDITISGPPPDPQTAAGVQVSLGQETTVVTPGAGTGSYSFDVMAGQSYTVTCFAEGESLQPGPAQYTNAASMSWQLLPSSQPMADTTTLSSSPNPSAFGQPVTLTANVTPTVPGSGTPTGSVTFMDGSTVLNPGGTALDGTGAATYPTSSLPVGTDSITAVYSGDSNFLTSTGTLSGGQRVAAPGVDLIGSVNNSSLLHHIYVGQQITVPIQVTNQGIAMAVGKMDISFFLSTKTSLDASAIPVSKSFRDLSINLTGLQSQTFQAHLTIPAGLQPGGYYLLAEVNSTQSITETNYGNNLAVSQQLVLPNSTAVPDKLATLLNGAITQSQQYGPPALPSGPFADAGENFTTAREGGLIPFPYLDSANIPTIGIGLNLNSKANRTRLKSELGLTNKQIDKLINDAEINGKVNNGTLTLTSGNQPIGAGIISVSQLEGLFIETYEAAENDAQTELSNNGIDWNSLSSDARIALTDLAFNRGAPAFATFATTGMFQALANNDVVSAAFDMMVAPTHKGKGPLYGLEVMSRGVFDFELLVAGFENDI